MLDIRLGVRGSRDSDRDSLVSGCATHRHAVAGDAFGSNSFEL